MEAAQKIGELARDLSVSIETIRYYEREGLLPTAARSGGNYRLYFDEQRRRLEFILHCRALDMSHEEIRQLIEISESPEAACEKVNQLLDDHIHHVVDRIRSLKRLETDLKALRARCASPNSAKDCGILQQLGARPASRAPKARGAHVGRHLHD